MDVLIVANVSRPNNFNSLTTPEWKWIITELKKDFSDLTLGELAKVITNGVKGEYDKTQFVVNAFTIYRWIKIFILTKPKVKIPCPSNIESFYWEQMSDIDQQRWLNSQPKQIDEHKK